MPETRDAMGRKPAVDKDNEYRSILIRFYFLLYRESNAPCGARVFASSLQRYILDQ